MFETDYSRMPKPFPEPCASDWGQDEYGIFQAITIVKVRQVFRWIFPGTFLMGSPEKEAERSDDELQHEVELTNGFWLADTACTQALWEAVMGSNPSKFRGKQNPVDTVGWDDCQTFLVKINGLVPGLDVRLPTEAEWEYACRAGTMTPFSFGENITSAQVNYNGNYPYKSGEKGEYREKTVEVKTLPCNNWGLYEMHGNVWEWCEDWYGAYRAEKVADPKVADNGEGRVLRGGSWIINGRLVRSAYRLRVFPGNCGSSTGFRLARGQKRVGK